MSRRGDGGPIGRAIRGAQRGATEIPKSCDYDVWGADFGVQAGAQCLNDDPAHREAHARSLWRFDVPAIPPGVTAFSDRDGDVWLLVRPGRWADAVEVKRGKPYADYAFVDLLAFAPLTQIPDPRKDPA